MNPHWHRPMCGAHHHRVHRHLSARAADSPLARCVSLPPPPPPPQPNFGPLSATPSPLCYLAPVCPTTTSPSALLSVHGTAVQLWHQSVFPPHWIQLWSAHHDHEHDGVAVRRPTSPPPPSSACSGSSSGGLVPPSTLWSRCAVSRILGPTCASTSIQVSDCESRRL